MQYKAPKLFYICSPYTHKEKWKEYERYQTVTKFSIELFLKGYHVFSPISYNAPWLEYTTKLDGQWKLWESFDKNFVSRCDALIVLMMDGWGDSIGIKAEVEFAKTLNKPVFYLTLEQVLNNDLKELEDYCS